MNRRDFLEKSATAIIATQVGALGLMSSCSKADGKETPQSGSEVTPRYGGLKVRFLGTGAADWTSAPYKGEHRNFSSVLIDDQILIDYTSMAKSMLPAGCSPKVIFYTHSHADHFVPKDALDLGIVTVYVGMTWYATAKKRFEEAVKTGNYKMPTIIGVNTLSPQVVGGITFTPLPANHGTNIQGEQALIYLMEKGDARVLYATDTGGIMAVGAQYAGFDNHVSNKKALTGLIMEATMGIDYDEDFRIFTHSSVGTVLRTAHVLQKTGLYKPKNNEPVYLTHMARTLHAPQSELVNTIPSPLYPAYDGLEVEY